MDPTPATAPGLEFLLPTPVGLRLHHPVKMFRLDIPFVSDHTFPDRPYVSHIPVPFGSFAASRVRPTTQP